MKLSSIFFEELNESKERLNEQFQENYIQAPNNASVLFFDALEGTIYECFNLPATNADGVQTQSNSNKAELSFSSQNKNKTKR